MSVWTGGERKGVHEDVGVSRGNMPPFRRQCNITDFFRGRVSGDGLVSDEELARIIREEPRRLCGHCFPTVDR